MIEWATRGLPLNGTRFLRLIPFEPPRAGMMASTFTLRPRSVVISPLPQVRPRGHRRDRGNCWFAVQGARAVPWPGKRGPRKWHFRLPARAERKETPAALFSLAAALAFHVDRRMPPQPTR